MPVPESLDVSAIYIPASIARRVFEIGCSGEEFVFFGMRSGCEDKITRAPASMCGAVAAGAAREGFAQMVRIALMITDGSEPDEDWADVDEAVAVSGRASRPFRAVVFAGAAFLRGRPAARLVGAAGSDGGGGFGPPGRAALNWLYSREYCFLGRGGRGWTSGRSRGWRILHVSSQHGL